MKLSKGFVYTFWAALSWAISIILVRLLMTQGENAYCLIFWTAFLQIPYWLFIISKRTKEFRLLNKKDLLLLATMGLNSSVGVGITEIFALKYSPSVNYSFLIRSVILFTILFAWLFLGEKLTLKKIILSLLILVGSYLLLTNGKIISFSLGDIFTLIEAVLIAVSNILAKMATNKMSPDLSASTSFLFGIIPLVIIAFLSRGIVVPQNSFFTVLLTIAYILLASLRFKAYKYATASFVTMVFSFTPVFVLLLAIPLLGETLTFWQALGGALIIWAGIAVEKLKI